MADEAFALSPISARAAQPSEADYDAIREAFLETSRGRWFLGEYAKRNRNADTSMVLDAVARIEDALAVQRQQQPAPDTRLEEALGAFRNVVDQADATVSAIVDGLALEQNLAPILKGARIVREISWRWREIGADSRICDLLDSQVGAIEAGCQQISSSDPRPALRAAFELIRAEIKAFGEADAAATETVEPAAPPPHEMPATGEEAEACAHDEALLDLVAMEMAAPDGADDFDITEPEFEQAPAAVAKLVEPEKAPAIAEAAAVVAQSRAILSSPRPTAAQSLREPSPAAPPQAPREAPAEVSLGSTIIASGILRKPNIPANDPLAPIRRMSQSEKIALFS
jgi:hypothetical protein